MRLSFSFEPAPAGPAVMAWSAKRAHEGCDLATYPNQGSTQITLEEAS